MVGRGGDLAVDEFVKNSVRVVTWTQAITAFGATAAVLRELATAIRKDF